MLTIFEIEKIVKGKIYNPLNFDINKVFTTFSIDSRNISHNSLFIALKGENFDGHDFVAQLENTCIALVEKIIDCSIVQILVEDCKKALQDLARYWRNQFDIPVVGVVGSNGKTTVKDMISSIFNQVGEYVATIGNLNNDIGLPLSILKMNKQHKLAVFEIGMNHPKETILLANILQPSIAVINNAQREHQEFMQTIEMVAVEHGYLLEETTKLKHAILPFDSEFFSMWANQCAKNNIYITSFGFGKANISAKNPHYEGNFTLNINYSNINHTQEINLACLGIHNICNALAAIACGIACGIDIQNIAIGIQNFCGTKGRLQKSLVGHKIIINDTYNANPDSVKAAIDVLANLPARRCLILGDMGEVGEHGALYHEEIGEYALSKNIDCICSLGNLSKHTTLKFYGKENKNTFFDIEELFIYIKDNLQYFDSILVKGSRFMRMERVIDFINKQ